MRGTFVSLLGLLSMCACDVVEPSLSVTRQRDTAVNSVWMPGTLAITSNAGNFASALNDGTVSWCCTSWAAVLPVPVGTKIQSIYTSVQDNGVLNNQPMNKTVVTLQSVINGVPQDLGEASSTGSGGEQNVLIVLVSPHTVASSETLRVRYTWSGDTNNAQITGAITVSTMLTPPAIVTDTISATIGVPLSNSVTWSSGNPGCRIKIPGGALARWTVPINIVRNGGTIYALRARVKDSAVGPTIAQIDFGRDTDGVLYDIATSTKSSGSGLWQTLPINFSPEHVTAGAQYFATLYVLQGSDFVEFHHIEVDHD